MLEATTRNCEKCQKLDMTSHCIPCTEVIHQVCYLLSLI